MLVLHQKRYLKGGSVQDLRAKLENVCAATNRGHAWLAANVSAEVPGRRCKWMGRPEVNATDATARPRPRRGPRRHAVRTSDREAALARIAAAEASREREVQEAHERRRRRKPARREPAARIAERVVSMSARNRLKRKDRLHLRRGGSVAYKAVAMA